MIYISVVFCLFTTAAQSPTLHSGSEFWIYWLLSLSYACYRVSVLYLANNQYNIITTTTITTTKNPNKERKNKAYNRERERERENEEKNTNKTKIIKLNNIASIVDCWWDRISTSEKKLFFFNSIALFVSNKKVNFLSSFSIEFCDFLLPFSIYCPSFFHLSLISN